MKRFLAGLLLLMAFAVLAQQGRPGSPLLGVEWARPADPILPMNEDMHAAAMTHFANMIRDLFETECAAQEEYTWAEPNLDRQLEIVAEIKEAMIAAGWTAPGPMIDTSPYYVPPTGSARLRLFKRGGEQALLNVAVYLYQGVMLDICLLP